MVSKEGQPCEIATDLLYFSLNNRFFWVNKAREQVAPFKIQRKPQFPTVPLL